MALLGRRLGDGQGVVGGCFAQTSDAVVPLVGHAWQQETYAKRAGAKLAGFMTVRGASGFAERLAELAKQRARPGCGRRGAGSFA